MYSRDCLRAQKQHGKESLPLAEHLDRLVNLLSKEGKLAEAEPISRRSMDIKLKALGEEHPEVRQQLSFTVCVYVHTYTHVAILIIDPP